MYIANGKFCQIEELTNQNDKKLFNLLKNNEKEYRLFVSDQPLPKSYDEFLEKLKCRFLVTKSEKDNIHSRCIKMV